MASVNLTEARVDALAFAGKREFVWDKHTRGLAVVLNEGAKTYVIQGAIRSNGRHVRTVRMKLARTSDMSLRDARTRASELMAQIRSGVDPSRAHRTGPMTVAEAMRAHVSERNLRDRTKEEYEYHVSHYLVGVRNRAIADLSRGEVRELFETIKRRSGAVTASNVMRSLRAVCNTARRIDPSIPDNPVLALRLPPPPKRKVGELDAPAFWEATASLTPQMRDLHRTFLLTGARLTSVLRVRRHEVDCGRGLLTFSHMKTQPDGMTYPMGRFLTDMLRRRMIEDEALNSEWLWPSVGSASGHMEQPRRHANIPSPHRLRHHNRTLAIAANCPYAESALLLGQTLPGASGGYLHREHLVEHLRPYAQKIEDLILSRSAHFGPGF
ncbi:MAG: integrase arm-type DNA-binding domain-containing protein [Hyphomonadaceae bacterium]